MVVNVLKTAAACVGAAIVAELGFSGAMMLTNDVQGTVNLVKETVNPEPVKVKTGLCKTTKVVYNPITDKVRPYSGDKKPINKKAVRMKKKYREQMNNVVK